MRNNMFVLIAIQSISWVLCVYSLEAVPFAYVCNDGSVTVSVIDVATNMVLPNPSSPIAVGTGPDILAITPDGKYAYVCNYSSNDVSVIDIATNTVISPSIPVGSGPDGIGITPDGKYAYVCNYGSDDVSVIDITTNTVISPSSIAVGSGPGFIGITPDGRYVYVPNYNEGTVTVIEVATNMVIPGPPITVGSGPAAIAITPNGRYAYVCNQFDNEVAVIDIHTNMLIPQSPIAVGGNPIGIAITPDGKYAYVCNQENSGTVSVIDLTTNTVISPSPVTVGPGPQGVAVTPDGKYVYVSNEFDSSITVIEVATNTVLPNPPSPIAVGLNPYAVTITPDQAPAARFTVKINNLKAKFNACASNSPVGTIANYEWDFGDGSPVQNTASPMISHIYGSFGSHTVTLIVKNSSGTSTYQTFTGQTVSNNGGPTARAVRAVQIIIAPPSKFVGKTKLHQEKKRLYLKTKWKKSTSTGIKKYEIFARNKKIASISVEDSLKKTIRLHPHHLPHHVSKSYRQYLSNKYRIRAVAAHGVVSPFKHVHVKP